MREKVLFVGGELHGTYGLISKNVNEIKRDVYSKIDLRKLIGFVRLKPLKAEIYWRKSIDGIEHFVLQEKLGRDDMN